MAKAKQLPITLTTIDKETSTLLCSLIAPVCTQEKSLEEVIEALVKHFEPKPGNLHGHQSTTAYQ